MRKHIANRSSCWIFTFDSLGGSHKAVCTHLNKWLEYEANDKEQIAHRRPRVGRYVEAKVRDAVPSPQAANLQLGPFTAQFFRLRIVSGALCQAASDELR